jgi:hypothetical protein
MGGNVRGFDDDRLRELFKPFGVEIPEFDGGGQEPGEVKPAPRAPLKKLVDPRTIN